jgi:hypothetical protein
MMMRVWVKFVASSKIQKIHPSKTLVTAYDWGLFMTGSLEISVHKLYSLSIACELILSYR